MSRQFCPNCKCMRETEIAYRDELFSINKEPITIRAKFVRCPVCSEEIFTFEYDDENLQRANDEYHKLFNDEQS